MSRSEPVPAGPITAGLIDSPTPAWTRERAADGRRLGEGTRMARGSKDNHQKSRRSSALGRAFGLMAFMPLASRAPMYARLMLSLIVDERTPAARKAFLAGAAGYVLVGRDLIPDEIPLLGGLDDLVVVVLAIDAFLDGVPEELLAEKLAELDIDRVAFDEDVARIRRLTPGPVRKTIRRIPDLLGQAGTAINESGIGPRLRQWINREEPIA
jgi:uncharacterized membrane protein YkvA (DUF1232 family)